jgi:hypothetical protein
MEKQQLLNKIKYDYEMGFTYFTGEIEGQEFKVRMNKNHKANGSRNNDYSLHNLSLINISDSSANFEREHNGRIQMQFDNVTSWEIAYEYLENFLNEILNNIN